MNTSFSNFPSTQKEKKENKKKLSTNHNKYPRIMMVGDHLDDLYCGRDANCVTVLLKNSTNAHFAPQADFVVDSLAEIVLLLRDGFALAPRAQSKQ